MHIADGVLPAWVSAGGWAITIPGLGLSLRRLPPEDIPRLGLLTAAVFMASLIHVPLGPTSVHLVLNGLTGILLGPLAFLAFFVALLLQALLFQFGGLFSLGVNTLVMGGPAFLVGWLSRRYPGIIRPFFSGILGGGAVLFSGILLALVLSLSGEAFYQVARLALVAHLPVAAVEGMVTALTVAALRRISPGLLPVALTLALLWVAPAQAHRLDMDVYIIPSGLRVEAYFPDGTPARGDQVLLFCGNRKVASTVTDKKGIALLPRPRCAEAHVVVMGKLGHRAERTVRLSSARPQAPTTTPSPSPVSPARSHREPFPINGVLAGLGFIFGLAGFILSWDTRRRFNRLASS